MTPPRRKPDEGAADTEQQDDNGAGAATEAAATEAAQEPTAQEPTTAESVEEPTADAPVEESVPEGALAPLEKESSDGTITFARDYLIEHSLELTGHPRHVMSGALFNEERTYLSADQATKLADRWLDTEVTVPEQN